MTIMDGHCTDTYFLQQGIVCKLHGALHAHAAGPGLTRPESGLNPGAQAIWVLLRGPAGLTRTGGAH